MNLILFRQYLESQKSFSDLLRLKQEFCTNTAFRNNTVVVVQVGKRIAEDAVLKYLEKKVSPQQGVINIYHISNEKAGLTAPILFGLNLAKREHSETLTIADSDFQFSVHAILNAIAEFRQQKKAMYFPHRKKRQLSIEGYLLNRYVIEDLENNFIHYRFKSSDNHNTVDFQSGMMLLNQSLIAELSFSPTSTWAGGLELIKNALDVGAQLIQGSSIETFPQKETSISYDIQLAKFKELERIFDCTTKDVVIHAIKTFTLNGDYSEKDFLLAVQEFLKWYD